MKFKIMSDEYSYYVYESVCECACVCVFSGTTHEIDDSNESSSFWMV